MIIFKNLKNVPKGNFPPDCVITVSKGGSVTKELMQQWTAEVWHTRPGGIFRQPALLICDKHLAHTHQEVHSTLIQRHNTLIQRHNTKCCVIPAGMTSLLQPCDVVWNKPMKSKVRAKWEDWLENGEQEFTQSG